MPRRIRSAPLPEGLDHRSATIVLAYLGGPDGTPSVAHVPARDLSANDVARVIYARSIGPRREEGLDGLQPADDGFDQLLAEVHAALEATGLYSADPDLLAERNAPPADPDTTAGTTGAED